MNLTQPLLFVNQIRQCLTHHAIQPQQQERLISSCVAKYLAYECTVPATKVKSVKHYFTQQLEQECNVIISAVNEQFAIDAVYVKDCVYRIWKVRYDVCHNPKSVEIKTLMSLAKLDKETPYVPTSREHNCERQLEGIFKACCSEKE